MSTMTLRAINTTKCTVHSRTPVTLLPFRYRLTKLEHGTIKMQNLMAQPPIKEIYPKEKSKTSKSMSHKPDQE